jgi:hypothetical protein
MDETGVRLDQSFERFTQFEESHNSYSGAIRHLAVQPVTPPPTPPALPSRPLRPQNPDHQRFPHGPPCRWMQDGGAPLAPTVGQWDVAVHVPREPGTAHTRIQPVTTPPARLSPSRVPSYLAGVRGPEIIEQDQQGWELARVQLSATHFVDRGFSDGTLT